LDSAYQSELTKAEPEINQNPRKYSETVRIAQFIAGPYLHEEEIEAIIANGPQAIVIHGTGLGHLPIDDPGDDAPENTKVWRALTRCVNRNIPVVVVTQCINGPIDMNVYSKGRKQQDMGLLGHGSVTSPDTTVVKIHYALSNNKDVADVLTQNLCGENHNVLRE
jgi:glutamyl-tRNA(Gln) amidotransferase subunit D